MGDFTVHMCVHGRPGRRRRIMGTQNSPKSAYCARGHFHENHLCALKIEEQKSAEDIHTVYAIKTSTKIAHFSQFFSLQFASLLLFRSKFYGVIYLFMEIKS